jgi:hypothetical protein
VEPDHRRILIVERKPALRDVLARIPHFALLRRANSDGRRPGTS